MKKTCLQWFPTIKDSNRPAQQQMLARVLEFSDAQADLRLCCLHLA